MRIPQFNGARTTSDIMRKSIRKKDPYKAKKGFWHSHLLWIFYKDPYVDEKYAATFRKDQWMVWQHQYYLPIVLSGFAIPFIVGFLHRGWIGGLSALLLAGVARTFLVLNSTFCINSICHMWGKQPYSTMNSSRDSWWDSMDPSDRHAPWLTRFSVERPRLVLVLILAATLLFLIPFPTGPHRHRPQEHALSDLRGATLE